MQTISENYRGLNEDLHKTNTSYGTSGKKWAGVVRMASMEINSTDILDYGCGKSTLAHSLPFPIHQYDPAIPRFRARPESADIVVCTDVLEHIEPDLIENVLDDISSLTKRVAILVVASGPAQKTLADGRNAHLIQEKAPWWMDKLVVRFSSVNIEDGGDAGFTAVCEK